MRPEILSTARPGRLRLIGFVALAAGALAAGVGSLLPWATIGLRTDTEHALDSVIFGIDVPEGIVVLVVAVASLIGLVVMRVSRAAAARAIVAVATGMGGLVVVGLGVLDWLTLDDRFVGGPELDRLARVIAPRLPDELADHVRQLLERKAHELVRVDVGPGLPVALAGGVLLIAAGALALAWARERNRPVVPAEPPAGDAAPVD